MWVWFVFDICPFGPRSAPNHIQVLAQVRAEFFPELTIILKIQLDGVTHTVQ